LAEQEAAVMIVRYDKLERLERPQFALCNPGSELLSNGTLSKAVGWLTDCEAVEFSFNFNATSELNFRINCVGDDDAEIRDHKYTMFRSVQNRRLVYADDIGFFVITGVTDGYDGHLRYKDIRAESVDVEIQQKKVPYIPDGTYRFQSDASNKGILETIVETLPLWTIGHIDSSLSNKWRTFEDVDVDKNCLSFMIEDIQNAYECIVLFDIASRTINIYDQSNYVHNTSVYLTKDDVINSLEISEDAGDLYTAVSVFGDDDVTISPINPTGSNVIYNFDYYLSWMSPELRNKVQSWQEEIDAVFDSYCNLNQSYYDKLAEASVKQSEINRIITQMTMYKRCRDNIVADGGTRLVDDYNEAIEEAGGIPIEIQETVEQTLAYIDSLIAACQNNLDAVNTSLELTNAEIGELGDQIGAIHETLAITRYFTNAEQEELSNYIYEGSYRDEYVTITDIMTYPEQFEQMRTLYDRAKAQLDRVSQPTQQFSIDSENFLFIKEFQDWSEQLETGCLINVEVDDGDMAQLFLSSITVNYDDRALSLTFGNRYNKFDPKSLFENVLGSVSKSANTLNFVKDMLYPVKNGELDRMQEAIQTSRDLTMGAALSSQNQEVVIDGSGYTGRELMSDGTYDPHQIKINGKNIVFTDDAWEHCKTALGELILANGESTYGLNAETIIGDLIVGNNLKILNSNGDDIFVVMDNMVISRVADVDSQINGPGGLSERMSTLEQTVEGFDLTVTEVTTTTGYTFNADGLTIRKSGEEIINMLDNTGMYVRKSTGGTEDGETFEDVLVANNQGVKAINLTADKYLVIGRHSRFEDYNDGADSNRTACFFIG
jgi:hypothetical protein